MRIRFGTSGWRAIIGDEFTFDNVRLVTQAIADYLKSKKQAGCVIVGYDTRFLSGDFAKVCAGVFTENNINVLLTSRDTPTPVIAYHIIASKLSGGINFTASHNPPEYNGLKFSPSYGGPASQEITSAIEKRIAYLRQNSCMQKIKSKAACASMKIFEPSRDYLKRIRNIVDIDCIKKAGLRIGVDCLYGTSRGYIDTLLRGACRELVVFNDYRDPLFGGFPPEPDKAYIKKLIFQIRNPRFNLGLACDGDGDRFGIVDKGGNFITPNEVITLLFYYLLKTRGRAKKVARTLATTHMIDAIARKEGLEVVETPVGFKYIGEALSRGDCLIGGEESGGLSIQGHVPEKDGILACLLIAEMVSREKRALRDTLAFLHKKYGYFCADRINLHLNKEEKEIIFERFKKLAKKDRFENLKIKNKNFTDGYKFIFDEGSWVLFRSSGTEPIIRCYFEANSMKKLRYLRQIISKIVRH